MTNKESERVREVCRGYFDAELEDTRPLGGGHINETFLVRTAGGRFVCQRLQPRMDAAKLERNFLLYRDAVREEGLRFPMWLRGRDGAFLSEDENGNHWRIYPYIPGEVPEPPLTGEILRACGQAIGRLHNAFRRMPGKPEAVYPMLHDLAWYYREYTELLQGPGLLREKRDPEMEARIKDGASRYLKLKLDRSSVVHGDTKLANFLFEGGSLSAVIDMDTVMEGSVLEDLADCIRSAWSIQGRADRALADALLQGYTAVAEEPVADGLHIIPEVIDKIYFEIALRYYTDYISERKRFRENYTGYRLEKARHYMEMIRADA